MDISVREVKKTQRPHICEWCAEKIIKGSQSVRRAYVFQGDFNYAHMHPECWRAMEKTDWRELEDGWSPGDYARGTNYPKNIFRF